MCSRDVMTMIVFLGECTAALWHAVRHPRTLRWGEVVAVATEAGANAVPIVLLIGFLMGVIIAFQIALVAQEFGAVIFVVNGVGIAMLRELGPLMTAIVFAGRTGAAFAAQIGTQKVNEEVNAIVTFGLDPVRFLVLPRLLAAALVMPLLSVLADVIGLFGGALVMLSFDIGFVQYYNQLLGAVQHVRLRHRPRQGDRLRSGDRSDRLPARPGHRRGRRLGGPLGDQHRGDEHRVDRGARRALRRADQPLGLSSGMISSATNSPASTGRAPAISVRNLTMGYGSRVLLEGASFDVQRGEILVILGGSGSGKSSMMKNLIGLYQPMAGDVLIDGQSIVTARRRREGAAAAQARGHVPERCAVRLPHDARERALPARSVHRHRAAGEEPHGAHAAATWSRWATPRR